jgi:hypothetical protein
VWTATKETPKDQVAMARSLLSSIGDQIEVKEENYLDMATAVSGSGPAYVFLVMEAMVDAAVHLGFPRDMAVKLVVATIRGSASYALDSQEPLSSLRNNVSVIKDRDWFSCIILIMYSIRFLLINLRSRYFLAIANYGCMLAIYIVHAQQSTMEPSAHYLQSGLLVSLSFSNLLPFYGRPKKLIDAPPALFQ